MEQPPITEVTNRDNLREDRTDLKRRDIKSTDKSLDKDIKLDEKADLKEKKPDIKEGDIKETERKEGEEEERRDEPLEEGKRSKPDLPGDAEGDKIEPAIEKKVKTDEKKESKDKEQPPVEK